MPNLQLSVIYYVASHGHSNKATLINILTIYCVLNWGWYIQSDLSHNFLLFDGFISYHGSGKGKWLFFGAAPHLHITIVTMATTAPQITIFRNLHHFFRYMTRVWPRCPLLYTTWTIFQQKRDSRVISYLICNISWHT